MGSPIYLPPNPNDLGAVLGNFLGNVGGAYLGDVNQKNALAATQGMDPVAQAAELSRRLGPQGVDLIKSLAAARQSALEGKKTDAEIARMQAETANSAVVMHLNQQKDAAFKQQQQLDEEETRAKISHENMLAAGSANEIALSRFKLTQAQEEAKRQKDLDALTAPLREQKIKEMLDNGASSTTSAAPVTPQIYRPGQSSQAQPISTDVSGASTQATAAGGQTPAEGTQKDAGSVVNQLGVQNPSLVPTLNKTLFNADPLDTTKAEQLRKAAFSQADLLELQANSTTNAEKSAQLLQAATRLRGEAERNYQQTTAPLSLRKEPLPGAPGYTAIVGEYPDGQTRIKNVLDERKPPSDQVVKTVNGLATWYATGAALKDSYEESPTKPGQDTFFKAIRRRIDDAAAQLGVALPPSSSTDPAFINERATYQHNLIGITLLAGNRAGQRMAQMFQELPPKQTDGPEVRQAKVLASEYTVKVMAKNFLDTLENEGKRVPPFLTVLGAKFHLRDMDLDQMAAEYAKQMQKAGLAKDGKVPDPTSEDGELMVPGTEKKKAASTPSPPPAGDGWTFKWSN